MASGSGTGRADRRRGQSGSARRSARRRCNSTKPSARISSISHGQPARCACPPQATTSWDYLAANTLGLAVYSEVFDGRIGPPNHVRYVFLDDRSRRFFDDWGVVAHDTARILRIEAGREPRDARPRELIDELLTVSDDFRTFWARHDVRLPASGRHHFDHPEVGPLELTFEAASLRADPDLTLLLATADPDSPTETALARLAVNH